MGRSSDPRRGVLRGLGGDRNAREKQVVVGNF